MPTFLFLPKSVLHITMHAYNFNDTFNEQELILMDWKSYKFCWKNEMTWGVFHCISTP